MIYKVDSESEDPSQLQTHSSEPLRIYILPKGPSTDARLALSLPSLKQKRPTKARSRAGDIGSMLHLPEKP